MLTFENTAVLVALAEIARAKGPTRRVASKPHVETEALLDRSQNPTRFMEVPFAAPERELSMRSAICYLLWLHDKEPLCRRWVTVAARRVVPTDVTEQCAC